MACHDRIEERLKTLERASASLETSPEEARAALESCFRYFETSGELHTRDEEESLFPRIVDRLSPEERAYLGALEAQHREADALYAELKKVPRAAAGVARYREVVERFCAHYRAHIASENGKLFGAARRVLGEAELRAISDEMKRRRGRA